MRVKKATAGLLLLRESSALVFVASIRHDWHFLLAEISPYCLTRALTLLEGSQCNYFAEAGHGSRFHTLCSARN